jgi:hypothetical protein
VPLGRLCRPAPLPTCALAGWATLPAPGPRLPGRLGRSHMGCGRAGLPRARPGAGVGRPRACSLPREARRWLRPSVVGRPRTRQIDPSPRRILGHCLEGVVLRNPDPYSKRDLSPMRLSKGHDGAGRGDKICSAAAAAVYCSL